MPFRTCSATRVSRLLFSSAGQQHRVKPTATPSSIQRRKRKQEGPALALPGGNWQSSSCSLAACKLSGDLGASILMLGEQICTFSLRRSDLMLGLEWGIIELLRIWRIFTGFNLRPHGQFFDHASKCTSTSTRLLRPWC